MAFVWGLHVLSGFYVYSSFNPTLIADSKLPPGVNMTLCLCLSTSTPCVLSRLHPALDRSELGLAWGRLLPPEIFLILITTTNEVGVKWVYMLC